MDRLEISMIGIDHSKALLEYREAFSFTKAGVKKAMTEIKEKYGAEECLIIATCNRTELWVSGSSHKKKLGEMLCELKGQDVKYFEEYFTERQEGEAIRHLLELVCGFESKIFGEDQIITQVREALALAQEADTINSGLEKVFQTALAAGKKVKTKVPISKVSRSSASDTIETLKAELGSLAGVRCLVIGNGQMGSLIAGSLAAHGALPAMTLRRRMHGREEHSSITPEGCHMVEYDDRQQAVGEHQVIISATLSPHFTLIADDIEPEFKPEACPWAKPDRWGNVRQYFFDLAVPRDIDPEIGKRRNTKLYDIDSMNSCGVQDENRDSIEAAKLILKNYEEEIYNWFEFRKYVPEVQNILDRLYEDAGERFRSLNTIRDDNDDESEADIIDEELTVSMAAEAGKRAAGKLIYGLKSELPKPLWEECIGALKRAAEKDTIKK